MDSNDLVGKTLGTCTLERLIGRGGMGAVYLAQQARPSRHVAVKVLLPNVPMNSKQYNEFLARFRREADVIARLEHVNIMPSYEYGEQDGLAYMVMPYLTGGSLRDVLTRRGALSLLEAATYLDQAASALDYAHAHGVIHRDIKPSNFLIHNDGRLVLADFGIARIVQEAGSTIGSSLTSTGMLVGTPDYIAPEMARGEQIDYRSDIYELGILLFQMITGHVPFTASTPLMVAVKHIQEPLPSLHEMNSAIPSSVDAVVQKATAKRREDRFLSTLELAQAFRAVITMPEYPSRNTAWNAPDPLSSQRVILPEPQQLYDNQYVVHPPVEASTPAGTRAASLATEAVHSAYSYPVTPHGSYPVTPQGILQQPEPKKALRPSKMFLVSLLLLAFIAGGIFIGLKVEGVLATPQSGGPNSTSLTAHNSSTPTPAQQATATVRQFYDDLNTDFTTRDYHDAYNLLGSDFQYSHPYNNFASGYAHTRHDDYTIGSVTSNADGTFKVAITIVATEDNSSGYGTHQSTYQGYYNVGQVNGVWKILSGYLQ